MRIYIASKYIEHKELNRELFQLIRQCGLDAFLPESINIDAITLSEMQRVAEICYEEIRKSDIVLAVSPFGKSVSAELGFSIALQKKIIAYKNMEKDEALLSPYFDYIVSTKEELSHLLLELKQR